jgi:hypothetical protein
MPLTLVVLLLPACSDAADEIADTTLAPATTEAVSTATTAAANATATPPTMSSTTGADAVVELPAPGEPWDVLYFGFDDLFTRLPAELYVERAVAALGVEVRMTHPSGFEHLYASSQLAQLRGERFPPLGEAARDAEIIVVLTRQDNIQEGPMGRINDDYLRCTWEISPGNPPADRPADYWDPYRQLMEDIYSKIWTLRQGLPTVLISIDFYMLDLAALREAGIAEACVEWWEEWSNQIAETASVHGSTMVSIFDLFNGPDHDIDPTDLGLIGPTDEDPSIAPYRVNPAGAILIADALAATGFEPASQP